LHSQWWAIREYEYKWTGLCSLGGEAGLGPPASSVFVGWNHIKAGDSLCLYHWNRYWRAFLGFDPTAFNGLNVTKATLTLNNVQGATNCYGALGRALLTKIPAAKFTSQTFKAPYPEDGDFSSFPMATQFNAGSATVDVTSLVQQWASGKMKNDGFVLRGKVDNGSNGNDSCFVTFATDIVLTITQQ